MQSQSLTVQGQQSLASIDPMADWQLMRQQADVLKASGFLPQAIKSAEAAMAIILIGRELNIPMMTALNNINVIQGKITIPPQLMMALINRTGELEDLKVSDENNAATVTMKRKGRASHTESFSMADAAKMLLDQKDNWRKQPRTMRKWRAIAACARIVFPDVITGLYIPEEMGAHVNDDGEIDLAMAEYVEEKPSAKTPRAALKAVPKAAPAVEVEQPREEVSAEIEAYERDLTDREAEDLIPEFEPRPTDETPEEVEAERQELIAHLKSVSYKCGATDEKWQEFEIVQDLYNRERGWLRNTIEVFEKKAAKIAEATAPLVLTDTQAKSLPGQLPDGRKKMQRENAEGKPVAVLEHEGAHMAGRVATHEQSIQNLNYWIDYWRTHTTQGQDLATIRAKVTRVVGQFHDWSDLNGADLAKAIRALQEWRPDLDEQVAQDRAQKGAKR